LSASLYGLGNYSAAREYAAQAVEIAQEIGARQDEGYALGHLGHALVALGALEEAADVYDRSLRLYQELGQFATSLESQAALALVEVRQGKQAQALKRVREILAWLDTHEEVALDDPLELYATCYQVIAVADEVALLDQGKALLRQTYTILQTRAAQIQNDALRAQFLEGVEQHREIMAAWKKAASEFL
jgi:tetratricopeptide (TPR) repeat protein